MTLRLYSPVLGRLAPRSASSSLQNMPCACIEFRIRLHGTEAAIMRVVVFWMSVSAAPVTSLGLV